MQYPVHNQEVVLQFEDQELELASAQNILESITEQLSKHGVTNAQVHENEFGVFKITYFSEEDVDSIKQTLQEFLEVTTDNSESDDSNDEEFYFQLSTKQGAYKLDVFEIQKESSNSGLGGKLAVIISDEYNKPSAPKTLTTLNKRTAWQDHAFSNQSSKTSGSQSINVDDASHIIPDVRAGPDFI